MIKQGDKSAGKLLITALGLGRIATFDMVQLWHVHGAVASGCIPYTYDTISFVHRYAVNRAHRYMESVFGSVF